MKEPMIHYRFKTGDSDFTDCLETACLDAIDWAEEEELYDEYREGEEVSLEFSIGIAKDIVTPEVTTEILNVLEKRVDQVISDFPDLGYKLGYPKRHLVKDAVQNLLFYDYVVEEIGTITIKGFIAEGGYYPDLQIKNEEVEKIVAYKDKLLKKRLKKIGKKK